MTILEQAIEHLFHAAWQATLVAAVVMLVVRWISLAPRLRYAILCVGVLKFALPPMLAFPTGLFSSMPPLDHAPFASSEWMPGAPVLIATGALYLMGFALAALRAVSLFRKLSAICAEATNVTDPRALELLASTARDLKIRRSVLLLESQTVTVPFATGWLRPKIVVSSDVTLKCDELRSVLAHELAHVSRHDIALRWLAAILGVVWWFHPLFAILRRNLLAASEECCDDLAISVKGVSVSGYRRALVNIAEQASRRTFEWAAAMGGEAEALRARVLRLASARSRSVPRWQVLLVALMAALFLPGLRLSSERLFPRLEVVLIHTESSGSDHDSRHAARHVQNH